MLICEVGISMGLTTIIIPVLRGLQNERNPNETISITAEQSAWFGIFFYFDNFKQN